MAVTSLSGNIEFNPFYLTKAIKSENELFRNIRVLGIKTWEEHRFSINSIFEISHLTTEIFFGKELSIHSPNGIANIGEVDFAFINSEKSIGRSVINITAAEIKSDFDKIIKQTTSNSHDIFFGVRKEVHSSVVDAFVNASKNDLVKTDSQEINFK